MPGGVGMIVVYKIDRLNRSLADFVRLVERLDSKGCSFVSVTQAFNTSTSMGRLTLNVLLSFAQFEREVTAERIPYVYEATKLWVTVKLAAYPVVGVVLSFDAALFSFALCRTGIVVKRS